MTIVRVAEGISWQYIFKARDIKEPESTFGGVAFESGVINEISLTQVQSFTYTVKLAWLGNDNDHAFFYDNAATTEEYTVSTYKQIKVSPDVDYDKVVLFLDFGRTPAGTTISLTDFCLQEHLEK